ncbi:hypothetical protein [Actinomyces mediterranea]|uniref:hypothetical protein n=1 Tax=Actinomyces mediterranea TaxID=1871028 RepID=UPI0009709369|nr:hypothetical protein [Actinomyces mediterranea]
MAHDQHDAASSIETTDIPRRHSRIRSMIFPLIIEIGVTAVLAVTAVYFVSGSHAEPENNAVAAVQTPQPVKSVRFEQSNAQSGDAQSAGRSDVQSAGTVEVEASDEVETYTPWVETENDGGYYQSDAGYYAPPVESAPVDTHVPQPDPAPQPESELEPVPPEEPVDPVDNGDNGADTQQSE